MTREEAAIHLPWLADIKHSTCRRATWHNYREPGLYMITIVVKGRQLLLGTLETVPHPRVNWTPLGAQIYTNERPKINCLYPMVKVWHMCIMPDHIHMIVRVNETLPNKRHLGHLIGAFKGGCTRLWWEMSAATAPWVLKERQSLFEDNYHDRLLSRPEQLEVWKKYLIDNPRRLAIKRQHPDFFSKVHQYMVGGRPYNIYGNRFLLDIPDKVAVVVHRRDSDADYRAKCDRWLACGERGGVLVGAAVAQREKAVMRVAMERGYAIICLMPNGFPPLYKPAGEAFDACAEGRFLQLSPWDYNPGYHKITRSQCLELNAIAESLAGPKGC